MRGMIVVIEQTSSLSAWFIMKVLTFGWDYPPSRNGGLGVACYGLTRELLAIGIQVVFVLPKRQPTIGNAQFRFATSDNPTTTIYEVPSALGPYHQSATLVDSIIGYESDGTPRRVSRSILEEVYQYAEKATAIALTEEFHLIHAHDWTSYLAGIKAKLATGKLLVLHVHATSFDQAASHNVDPAIYQIEKEAFAVADQIFTVSGYTKNILVEKHGVEANKITVVHNGCDTCEPLRHEPALQALKAQGKKIILYHGRITIQKGVDYFVRAARRVIEVDPNVIFVISGWGDMTHQIMEQVGEFNLSGHVIFAGSLWEEERDRMYQTADLVVMPSVSEPFGLVPLEAIQHGTPSLISKQSGVKEVLTHVLKVDFWDVDEMANQIIASIRYDALHHQLAVEGKKEIGRLSWKNVASKVKQLYQQVLNLVSV